MGNKKAVNRKDSMIRSNSKDTIDVGPQVAVRAEDFLANQMRRRLKKAQKEASWRAKEMRTQTTGL